MAFRVIDDGLTSNELNEVQKKNLKSIRTAILCEEIHRLSLYLVIKPVIKKCFNKGHYIYNTVMKSLIKSLLFVIILMPIASFPDTIAEEKTYI